MLEDTQEMRIFRKTEKLQFSRFLGDLEKKETPLYILKRYLQTVPSYAQFPEKCLDIFTYLDIHRRYISHRNICHRNIYLFG